ncbi:MAG: hypothetical protein GX159_03825 [Flavobacteriaceae bacterium]|jgi:hypothetical protein|nr:hypothetical protein [Flavobacteriaceae bacterium]
MRINNKRINVYFDVINTLLLIGFFFSILHLFMPIHFLTKIISPAALSGIFILAIYIVYRLGPQHVEYNSDGEVLNIKTQDAFWAKHFPKMRRLVDFPKRKLISYKIKQCLFLKHLELTIKSKRSQTGISKLRFNITFLSHSEISDLKRSLNRIVKRNKEEVPIENQEVNP